MSHFTYRIVDSLLVLAWLLPLAGCGPQTELTLRQPLAPPAQQNLKLATEWAYYTTAAGRDIYVLTFPLPGGQAGPRAFVIYLIAAAGTGTFDIDPNAPQGVRGFLIQEVGALAGRSDFVSGTMRARKMLLSPRARQLDLKIHCDDGSEVIGRALVAEGQREVAVFEREFAGDIAQLAPPESETAPDDQATTTGSTSPPG